jgi:hypothetical protein
VLASVLLLVLFAVVALPLSIRGDGTLNGYVAVTLDYTLGAVFILLSIATAWAAAASASIEISNHRIDLVITKPVSPLQIWIGKWLGIALMNAVLLAVAGSLVYGLLRWTTRPSALDPEDRRRLATEILTTRRVVEPVERISDEQVRNEYDALRRQNRFPVGITPAQACLSIRRTLMTRAGMVAPGQARRWTFDAPSRRSGAGLVVRFKFASSRQTDRTPVRGLWEVGPGPGTNRFLAVADCAPDVPHSLEVPWSAIAPDRPLVLEFSNVEVRSPATVVFYPGPGPTVLIPSGRIESNLARSLAIMFFFTGFLGALGLTAGTLLSLPVATFAAFSALLVLSFGDYIRRVAATGVFYMTHHGGFPSPGPLDSILLILFRVLNVVVGPLTGLDPVGPVAEGRLIPWSDVVRAFIVLGVLASGALCLAGGWLFRRREIGLIPG